MVGLSFDKWAPFGLSGEVEVAGDISAALLVDTDDGHYEDTVLPVDHDSQSMDDLVYNYSHLACHHRLYDADHYKCVRGLKG